MLNQIPVVNNVAFLSKTLYDSCTKTEQYQPKNQIERDQHTFNQLERMAIITGHVLQLISVATTAYNIYNKQDLLKKPTLAISIPVALGIQMYRTGYSLTNDPFKRKQLEEQEGRFKAALLLSPKLIFTNFFPKRVADIASIVFLNIMQFTDRPCADIVNIFFKQ